MIETLISQKIRSKFPYLRTNSEVIYLDNAATSLMPESVIEAMARYMRAAGGSAGRGQSEITQKITRLQRELKKSVAGFFGAESEESIAVRSATEALNGIVRGWGENNLVANDQILLCMAEHHSHVVPWQMMALRNGWEVQFFTPDMETGKIDLVALDQKMRTMPNLQYVGVAQVSNVLGVRNPVREITKRIKRLNEERRERNNGEEQRKKGGGRPIRLGVDGAQGAVEGFSGVKGAGFSASGVDFYTFSGHKMFGPTNIGGLLVRKELIENGEMQPWMFGGGAINRVTTKSTETKLANNIQQQFEAGTIDVMGLVGLVAAMQFILELEMKYGLTREDLAQHKVDLAKKLKEDIRERAEIKDKFEFLPAENEEVEIVTMISKKYHPQDVANYLDSQKIAIRVGQHCAQLIHEASKVEETIRFSFGPFNTKTEIERVVEKMAQIGNFIAG